MVVESERVREESMNSQNDDGIGEKDLAMEEDEPTDLPALVDE